VCVCVCVCVCGAAVRSGGITGLLICVLCDRTVSESGYKANYT
jgi:hypothetical protein